MSDNSNTKYLIIGTGRNGSSLLSAILNGAGADFGIDFKKEWDKEEGEFEHPYIHEAYKWHSRAEKTKKSLIPGNLVRNFCINRRDAYLDSLLQEVDYVKSAKLVYLVHTIKFQLDYDVKIIGLIRPFSSVLKSYYKKFGKKFMDYKEQYHETSATMLLISKILPTIFISYKDLTSKENTEWLEHLSEFTGLDRSELEDVRNEITDFSSVDSKKDEDLETKMTEKHYSLLSKNKLNFD